MVRETPVRSLWRRELGRGIGEVERFGRPKPRDARPESSSAQTEGRESTGDRIGEFVRRICGREFRRQSRGECYDVSTDFIISPGDRILVTGSNGFIGAKVVELLVEYGFTKLRCFVRPSSKLDRLERLRGRFPAGRGLELVLGDLLSREDCRKATEGVAVIFHLAAGIEKSFAGAFMNSALTTRNLMDAFLEEAQPKRFVNISSFAVYSNLGLKRGAVLDETCPLEDSPQERSDPYCFGKLKQEELVKEYGKRQRLPYVIVRPGAVFGPGKPSLSGRVGIDTFGFFIHLGGSTNCP